MRSGIFGYHYQQLARFLWILSLGGVLFMGVAIAQDPTSQLELEQKFDTYISSREMSDWMKEMASEPNHVGSPHNKANAEWVLAQFQKWGWDAHMETFEVLYPTPISVSLELLGKTPFKVPLTEPAIEGDTTSRSKERGLPAYLAYQGDGDVTAPLVYVNYGMQEDYETLQQQGVSVEGKIVIARYGNGWRGLKPKLAQEHGAVGCIIYSDPADDGYGVDDFYPKGAARPPSGFQRGSVADTTQYDGDPLTPGIGATKDAKRLSLNEAKSILKIPVLPISYGSAQKLLETMTGNVVPKSWRGALPITYKVGPSEAKVHLQVKSDWSMKTLYNVIAKFEGSEYPDHWVMRGNHRDAWVYGASDPLSGHVVLLEEAKAIGALVQAGFKPKRTIVYMSWDGEEAGLLGSTEWAETHAAELKQKAVVYINSDSNQRGFIVAGGNHDLQHFVNGVLSDVEDPQTKVSVGQRLRAKIRTLAFDRGNPEAEAMAKIAADPSKDLPIRALGSGSDYTAFLDHLGLAALNIGYGGEGKTAGVYHSAYDTFEHFSRFADPGFVYAAVLVKTMGRLILRATQADLPLQRATGFAQTVTKYVDEVKKLADKRREEAKIQSKVVADKAFALAADPTETSAPPDAMKSVPNFNFEPLQNAATRLEKSALAYDAALEKAKVGVNKEKRDKLWSLMLTINQTLAPDIGLPGRPWFRNLIYAPGRLTGYGAKTLPAVREGIEDEKFDETERYISITADAINAYTDRLDEAIKILKK